jgi:hypothetical protein
MELGESKLNLLSSGNNEITNITAETMKKNCGL